MQLSKDPSLYLRDVESWNTEHVLEVCVSYLAISMKCRFATVYVFKTDNNNCCEDVQRRKRERRR